ncbi:unnamed protein product [Meloidogyne enterolobii]|uniref:Uncharacterized protein n=1 Tax=Meloidogyne enterolobii TaxID=390850 RepID=A0ACB1AFN3_MELEN
MYDQYTDSEEEESLPSTSKASSIKSNKKRNSIKEVVENSLEKKDEIPIKNKETALIKQKEEKSEHPINVQVEENIKINEKIKSIENSPPKQQRKETIKTQQQQIKKKEKQIEETKKQIVEVKQEREHFQKQFPDFHYLPDEFPTEQSDHYSLTCHLFPRMSESNLQFHDIYWDKNEQVKSRGNWVKEIFLELRAPNPLHRAPNPLYNPYYPMYSRRLDCSFRFTIRPENYNG